MQSNLDPVVLRRRVISQERWRLVLVHHKNVEISIVVEIAEGATAAHMTRGDCGIGGVVEFEKCSVSLITEDDPRTASGILGVDRFEFRVDLPSDEEYVWITIVIEIE